MARDTQPPFVFHPSRFDTTRLCPCTSLHLRARTTTAGTRTRIACAPAHAPSDLPNRRTLHHPMACGRSGIASGRFQCFVLAPKRPWRYSLDPPTPSSPGPNAIAHGHGLLLCLLPLAICLCDDCAAVPETVADGQDCRGARLWRKAECRARAEGRHLLALPAALAVLGSPCVL